MTASNVAATQAVAYKFIDATFPWLPKPKIIEWDNIAGGTRDYSTATTISVPRWSDTWSDGRYDTVIHEVGHVVVFYCSQFADVIGPFLTAMGGDPALRDNRLINEIIAEHFARAYVDGYTGVNYPELVGLVPFDKDKTRAFFASLSPANTTASNPASLPPLQKEPAIPTATLRYCYDSTTAADIPAGAQIVAGYIDGIFAWSEADWALHPGAVKVRIACFSGTDDGDVGDVERGDMTPAAGVEWVQMRRAAGADPTVYTGLGQWPAVRSAFTQAGVPQPHYWIAHYDNDPTPIDGAFAKQYANPTWTGKHYDLSIVQGPWPGVEEVEVTDEEFIEKTRRIITPTIEAMKAAYDPLIVQARANGLVDATQEAHLAALDQRLAKLREV